MNTSNLWDVLLAGPARKSLERIPSPDRQRIEDALAKMAEDPFRGDIKLLRGQGRTFRRRVGAWRIFFHRIPDQKRIEITAIERRSSTTY